MNSSSENSKSRLALKQQVLLMLLPFFAMAMLLVSCGNKKSLATQAQQSKIVSKTASKPALITDTLQFIHFDGNADYWISVFLNSKKDTITLVTDTTIASKFKNSLLAVKWFIDTLYEAGDHDRKYTAKRLSSFRQIGGKPFVAPVTEQQILSDVKHIPEVQSGADQVAIAERPTDDKNYYLVETGTHGEDNYSRFYLFRVYIYPKYEIRVYDPAKDTDLSLADWRRQNQ